MKSAYILVKEEKILARLEPIAPEENYLKCKFIPTPIFEKQYKEKFDATLKLLESQKIEEMMQRYEEIISEGIKLKFGNHFIEDFFLNIDSEKSLAWFRE